MLIQYEDKCLLARVISGGQTGADQAGIFSARACGYETGGHAPAGYRTLAGNNPELGKIFGLETTTQRNYQVRTALNVKNSDATFRLATNFNSPGELCTLKAINLYKKPYFDVDLKKCDQKAYIQQRVDEAIDFLIQHQVVTLNIAGNADRTPASGFGLHFKEASNFLLELFNKIQGKHESL